MMAVLLVIMLPVSGCSQTKNVLMLGKPDHVKRDVNVTDTDLQIPNRGVELLSSEDQWMQV